MVYFIEFKNQYASDIDSQQMKEKFKQGASLIKNLMGQPVLKDISYVFCVVFKDAKGDAFNSYKSYFNSSLTRFGLEDTNKEIGKFYNQIITNSISFYKQTFSELECVESC